MDKLKKINYNFFHWGPFLYRTVITKEEVDQVKKLCSKQNKDVRETLAGLLEHEHKIDHKKSGTKKNILWSKPIFVIKHEYFCS